MRVLIEICQVAYYGMFVGSHDGLYGQRDCFFLYPGYVPPHHKDEPQNVDFPQRLSTLHKEPSLTQQSLAEQVVGGHGCQRWRKEVTRMESNDPQQERQQAHAYLDHLPAAQVAAVRGLLEAMLDPVSRALANAPIDDEPITEEEERAVAEARQSLKRNGGIPFEQAIAELGFTMEEVRNYQDPS